MLPPRSTNIWAKSQQSGRGEILGLIEGILTDGLIEILELKLIEIDGLIEIEVENWLIEGLIEILGLKLIEGDRLIEIDGLIEILGLKLIEGLNEILTDGLIEILGLKLGLGKRIWNHKNTEASKIQPVSL